MSYDDNDGDEYWMSYDIVVGIPAQMVRFFDCRELFSVAVTTIVIGKMYVIGMIVKQFVTGFWMSYDIVVAIPIVIENVFGKMYVIGNGMWSGNVTTEKN